MRLPMPTALAGLALTMCVLNLSPQANAEEYRGDPYPLLTCPVSGEALGTMGAPIEYVSEGRQVKFCCAGCKPQFQKATEKFTAKMDEQIIQRQAAYYPLKTDIVSDDPLGDNPVDIVFFNRLVRFSSASNANKFFQRPDRYLEKLDLAVIETQSESYPLDTCLVSGEPLGEQDEVIEAVIANRLIKFCSEEAMETFKANPHEYVGKLDSAWGMTVGGKGKKTDEGSEHK